MSLRNLVLIVLVLCSCSRPVPPDRVPTDPAPPEPMPPPATRACAQLKELACINSEDCTLVVAEDSSLEYLCRDAVGPCETGFRQRGGDAEACEAKPGCRFVPGQCYCSPDVTCICGGGPPAQCVES